MNTLVGAESRIALRSCQEKDEAFLFLVYSSTRQDELALVDWPLQQKEAFLRMQFDAQRQHYLIHYPQAEYSVISEDGRPIGRLIVDRSQDPILLIDLALLPEHRNQGTGTGLIRALMAEAAGLEKGLRLHVETFNPAIWLYRRLGFVKTGELGIYHEMTWRPEAG